MLSSLNLVCSVFSFLTYFKDFELYIHIGLAFSRALEDHHFVVGGTEALLSRNFEYKLNKFFTMVFKVGRNFITDNTSKGVNLSYDVRLNTAS